MHNPTCEPSNEAWIDHRASVAALAHELRQPLANLSYAAALLQREPLSPHALAAVAIAQRQIHQMSRMIEDLLDEARCARGTVSLRLQSFDLRAMVEAVALDTRARVAQHGHELVVTAGDRPLWVEADPDRIRQVLSNLIDNAIKFTVRGGRIEVRAGQSGAKVVLEIKDSGHGLTALQLARMLELFDHTRPAHGLGIGLTIVRDIVTLHGGTVAAHSDGLGHGAAFTVTLPRDMAVGRKARPSMADGWDRGPAMPRANGTAGNSHSGERSISTTHSPRRLAVTIPPTGMALEEIERQAVVEALRMSNGVQKGAADLLRISPRVMNYKIKILNIEVPR